MSNPMPANEPIKSYAPGTPERASLKAKLTEMKGESFDMASVINGKEIRTGDTKTVHPPHERAHTLGVYHTCGAGDVQNAIDGAVAAREDWARMPFEERAAIFLRAADLLETTWRDTINAATMLGQSKNAFQAEIDSACELIDFWRFNVAFARQIRADQPISPEGFSNRLEYRPLEGFVFAVTPFNFTSIAGNLPTAPALMGNTVIWKPARTSALSSWLLYQLLLEAGLPDGVINMVMGEGRAVGDAVLASEHLAGLHFTGSTEVFQSMWRTIGGNIERYRSYPRIVGETGGKDFILAHASSEAEALATAILRGSFEYQGQKCSAASRVYVPDNLWPAVQDKLLEDMAQLRMGPVEDFGNFINAVIDQSAFDRISGYIEHAKSAPDAEIIAGGGCDDSEGYFIEPTVILTTNPKYRSMCQEIFGPVVTIFVYPADEFEGALQLVDETSPYALTGAIFAADQAVVDRASDALLDAAGNFYINDKPTGAVVGQQPFGGGRASGTNDKAGSLLNLTRWVSPRTVKETFESPTDFRYPFLSSDK
jgi:1-pyrroline-5-carboxylate dehydrogenase